MKKKVCLFCKFFKFNNKNLSRAKLTPSYTYTKNPTVVVDLATNNFDEAFEYIKSNSFNYLTAFKIGKIKIIKFSSLSNLTNYYYTKYNFKNLCIYNQYEEEENLSFQELKENLTYKDYVDFINDNFSDLK